MCFFIIIRFPALSDVPFSGLVFLFCKFRALGYLEIGRGLCLWSASIEWVEPTLRRQLPYTVRGGADFYSFGGAQRPQFLLSSVERLALPCPVSSVPLGKCRKSGSAPTVPLDKCRGQAGPMCRIGAWPKATPMSRRSAG